MPPDAVLIDTTALLGLANADDALHKPVSIAYAALTAARAPLVTTEWILLEFLNGAARPPLRSAAIGLVGALRRSPRFTLVPASHEAWERTLALYTDRADKSWSFVDCASILTCQERQIRRVLSHDRHFSQAGLEILVRT